MKTNPHLHPEELAAGKLHAGICEDRSGQPASLFRPPYWQGLLVACSVLVGCTLKAATFTVTTTADSGAGSLRQAILDANGDPGPDEIRFNIPGAGVQTINPLTPPPIITDTVHIDGYTQPGAAPATATSTATILIEWSGALLPEAAGRVYGFWLDAGSSGSSIRGLSINRFKRVGGIGGHAIFVSGGSGYHWIAGNYLNVAPDGSTVFTGSPSFGYGYSDGGTGNNAGNNIIGYDPSGPNSANPAADRNIISGSGSDGFGLLMTRLTAGNQIRGNYIGTDASGTLDRGNALDGIQLACGGNIVENNLISGNNGFGIITFTNATSDANIIRGNYIGTDVSGTLDLGNSQVGIQSERGGEVIANNLISANGRMGIALLVFGNNTVTGNKIGTDVSGTLDLGNKALAGILIASGSGNNTIGGLAEGDGNTIAFNPVGIVVDPTAGPGNTILGNSIFSNDGLGIDLGAIGVTANDACDGDTGTNDVQNFPVLISALANPNGSTTISGTLDSRTNSSFVIEFFTNTACDPAGNGEGQQLIGRTNVTTASNCSNFFKITFTNTIPAGRFITATATEAGTNTSEFSACVEVTDKPRFAGPIVSGSNLRLSGSGGAAGGSYRLLSSTNLTLPRATWTQVTNGSFDGSGNFSVNVPVDMGEPQRFYLLAVP